MNSPKGQGTLHQSEKCGLEAAILWETSRSLGRHGVGGNMGVPSRISGGRGYSDSEEVEGSCHKRVGSAGELTSESTVLGAQHAQARQFLQMAHQPDWFPVRKTPCF